MSILSIMVLQVSLASQCRDERLCSLLLLHGGREACSYDDVSSVTGFSNWKNALEKFENHKHTKSHCEAMLSVSIPGTTRDVGELLSTSHAKEKAESREMLKVILSH